MTDKLKQESSNKCFGGYQKVFSHDSAELQCRMKFAVFEPPQISDGPVPVVYWLSGLTCSEQNYTTKAGGQKYAAKYGYLVVAPDTSPRGCNIEGEDDDWDFGTGAGFYVNATEEKWKKHYRMFAYVTEELPALISANYSVVPGANAVMGHSMGGHGALICALRKPGMYKSVSAFSPICHPSECPWGIKAFSGYLGPNKETWLNYDACHLAKNYSGPPLQILVDQGTSDQFYTQKQLLPEDLVSSSESNNNVSVILRMLEDYDHSYYFMASFIEDHFDHHAKFLSI